LLLLGFYTHIVTIYALHPIFNQQTGVYFFEGRKQVGETALCRMTSYPFPARHEMAPVPKCTKSLYSWKPENSERAQGGGVGDNIQVVSLFSSRLVLVGNQLPR